MFPTKFRNPPIKDGNNNTVSGVSREPESEDVKSETSSHRIGGELGMINDHNEFQYFRGKQMQVNENIRKKLDFFLITQRIPHIIFHGSSGTGKRTIVYDFINRIYHFDKQKIKSNVMFVNCAHGKGIKFIREDLKFFAKTNIQSNSGVMFKSIVLLNADFLTIDAQSALRRCIELFSHNTRFFIIVENKHKLLNPILSRFCEIYVPEHIDNGRIVNLHKYDLSAKMNMAFHDREKKDFVQEMIFKIASRGDLTHKMLVDFSIEFYENGISSLDIIEFIEKSDLFEEENKIEYISEFYRIKSEYRCEKLLMLYIFDMLYMRSK